MGHNGQSSGTNRGNSTERADPMQIEEYQLVAKTGNSDTCEDAIVVNDRFVAVLDGATSVADFADSEVTPGRRAVERVAEMLERLPGDVDMFGCMSALNAVVAQIYHDDGIYETARDNPEYRCSAAAIVYSRARSELWLIGDCQALVDGELITAWKDADELLSEVRAMFLESELLRGRSVEELREHDTARDYISELLRRQKRFQNSSEDLPYAFFVLDGFLDTVEKAVQVHEVPASCRELVLASDGYPYLRPTLEESERELQQILSADPLCFREFKSTKGVYSGNVSFDDRSYVRVRFNGAATT